MSSSSLFVFVAVALCVAVSGNPLIPKYASTRSSKNRLFTLAEKLPAYVRKGARAALAVNVTQDRQLTRGGPQPKSKYITFTEFSDLYCQEPIRETGVLARKCING